MKFIKSEISAILLLCCMACAKNAPEGDISGLKGSWCPVTEDGMVDHYMEIGSGRIRIFVSPEAVYARNDTLWGCSQSLFKEKFSEPYSVSEGLLLNSTTCYGKVSVKDNELSVGNSKFLRINGITADFYTEIIPSDKLYVIPFDGGVTAVDAMLKRPVKGYETIVLRSDDSWITVEGLTVTASANNTDRMRKAAVSLTNAFAATRTIEITQPAWGQSAEFNLTVQQHYRM